LENASYSYDIFVSYAKSDEAWVHGYLLDALQTSGIKHLTEEDFRPGVPKLSEYERAITQSRYTLLILTPAYTTDAFGEFVDFLANYHGRQQGNWPVLPLLLKATDLPLRLAHLVPVNAIDPTYWQVALDRIAGLLETAISPSGDTPQCPYPGMVPFTEKQADVFFGRDKEIADGVERLRQYPFLTVIGPSGSGKSSLVYAGVIPALRKSKRFGAGEWDVRILRPGTKPLTALADALSATPEQLASATFNQRTLLFIDQFEELFTLAEAAQAQGFLDALNVLIGKQNLYILLTVRADFYPDLMACSLWQPIRANRLELTPLGDEELRAAILQPAAQVGVTIDEVLAERLVGDAAGESGSLPLVQETLVLLWEKVERRHLALKAYTEMAEGNRNGLQMAIDRRATVVYENLPDDAKPIARRIFLRLIQFGEGRADTRRQQTVDELRVSGDDQAIFDTTLDRLTESRLLTTSGEEGSTRRVDIAHEALIGGWRMLREWAQDMRDREMVRRRLEATSRRFREAQGRSGLLDIGELREAEQLMSGPFAEALGVSEALRKLMESSRDNLRKTRVREIGVPILSVLALVLITMVALATYRGWLRGQAQKASPLVAMEVASVTFGSDDPDLNRLSHPAWSSQLPAFQIEQFEVTNRLYCLCIRANHCTVESETTRSAICAEEGAELPVTQITLAAAETYCQWLGRRLPLELEWEHAARGKENRIYPNGDNLPSSNDTNLASAGLRAVTMQPVDVTKEGVYGMTGNVSVWTISPALAYSDEAYGENWWPHMDLPEPDRVIIRGGNWRSQPTSAHSSLRIPWDAREGVDFIGMRCVFGLPPAQVLSAVNQYR